MSNIHFRIDEEIKRLAMKAAERLDTNLTDLMRQRVEELATEELKRKESEHDVWLEQQIEDAFSRYEAGQVSFISNDEANNHMAALREKALRGEL